MIGSDGLVFNDIHFICMIINNVMIIHHQVETLNMESAASSQFIIMINIVFSL